MINPVAKGRRLELNYKKFKESQGYICYKPIKSGRFTKQQDIFGLFDVVCINKKEVLLVQVKANRKIGTGEIRSFTEHPLSVRKILAVKKDYQDWEEFEIN